MSRELVIDSIVFLIGILLFTAGLVGAIDGAFHIPDRHVGQFTISFIVFITGLLVLSTWINLGVEE